MVFCLLDVPPCAAALATIHRKAEAGNGPFFEAFFQLATVVVLRGLPSHKQFVNKGNSFV